MFVDFGRIKRKALRRLRHSRAYLGGMLYAAGLLALGRLQRLQTLLQNTGKEMEAQVDELVKSDDRVLFVTIGQALTAWATMEEALVFVLAYLLRTEVQKAGLILYSTINFSVWLSIIDELFVMDETFSPLKPKWNKVAARLRALKDDRDRIAHHSVRYDGESTLGIIETVIRPGRMDIRRKSLKYKPMGNDDVINFSSAVITLTHDLIVLVQEMTAMPRSSQEKSAE